MGRFPIEGWHGGPKGWGERRSPRQAEEGLAKFRGIGEKHRSLAVAAHYELLLQRLTADLY